MFAMYIILKNEIDIRYDNQRGIMILFCKLENIQVKIIVIRWSTFGSHFTRTILRLLIQIKN